MKNSKLTRFKQNDSIIVEISGQLVKARVLKNTIGFIHCLINDPQTKKTKIYKVPTSRFIDVSDKPHLEIPAITELEPGIPVNWECNGVKQSGVVVSQKKVGRTNLEALVQVYNEALDCIQSVSFFEITKTNKFLYEEVNSMPQLEGFKIKHIQQDEDGHTIQAVISFWEKHVAGITFNKNGVELRDIDVKGGANGLNALLKEWVSINNRDDIEPFGAWIDWHLNHWNKNRTSDKKYFLGSRGIAA